MSQTDCIFCKIVSHEVPSTVVFEDEDFLAFKDLYPEAPTHLLVIPKKHVERMTQMANDPDLEKLWNRAFALTQKLGIEENCKFAVNNGKSAGQIVPHVHIHILSQKAT